MILSCARVERMVDWNLDREGIVAVLRSSINATRPFTAAADTEDGVEIVEIVYMEKDPLGTWRSSLPENATHVRVTLEVNAE